MEQIPRVGLGVIIIKDNKILMGKRKSAHGEGTWAFPGGHLEFNEEFDQCAIREVQEEIGIKIKNLRFVTATNDIFEKENKHYITIYIIAEYDSGEVGILEPDRCEKWEWIEWDNLPRPLFVPIQNLLKQNFNPFQAIRKP